MACCHVDTLCDVTRWALFRNKSTHVEPKDAPEEVAMARGKARLNTIPHAVVLTLICCIYTVSILYVTVCVHAG